MITADGAGIIATIIPIGLLIVGFEIQRVPEFVAAGRAGTVTLWILGIVLVAALVLGFMAESRLIQHLASGESIPTADAVVVWVALNFLGLGCFFLLFASLAEKLGILAWMSRSAAKRTAHSPRRRARELRYIEKHHPGSGA